MGADTGFSVESGTVHVTSKVAGELEKRGTLQKGRVIVESAGAAGDLGMALGMQSSTVQGTDAARGIRQSYHVVSPSFDIMFHFNLFKGLGAGLLLQNQFGKGASYGVADEKRLVYVMSVGPSLIYRLHLGKFDVFAGLDYILNQTGKERTVATQVANIGMSYGVDRGGGSAPASPSAQPRI